MLNRRTFFKLGLLGSAGALLSWQALRAATSRPTALSPVLTPFLDQLPLPPLPRELDWQPNQLPFNDLDPEAMKFVDPSQVKGKATFYRIVSEVRSVKFHAQLPATEIWGYRDGNLPAGQKWDFALGPTFKRPLSNDNAFVGTIVRHENKLPSVREHRGFGEPRNSTHLHGGHVPARSDGFPTDIALADGTPFNVTFEHGQHFDYAYPLLDPGFFEEGHGAHTERPSTLWYHDHLLDFTAQNVYRGLAGIFLVHDNPVLDPRESVDCKKALIEHTRDIGDETNATGKALQLPSGDFDIPLVLQEKTFGLNGELIYDVFNTDGFLGENFLVNGMVQPFLPVKRRKYRFRFLNASNARIYQLFLADKNGRSYPMTQIATEGGLLSRRVQRPSFLLGMAERVEVVIDFSQFAHPQFTELYIENRMLQDDGRGPNGEFERPKLAARGTQLLKFKLEEVVPDPSRVPDELRPFKAITALELSDASTRIRTFVFERTNGQWAINGEFAGDLSRAMVQPVRGEGEIWRLINKSGGWWHPIHVHHEHMRVLKRNGRLPFDGTGPDFGQSLERDGLARKDTIVLGPNSEVEVFVKFRDYRGPFVFHCHNMEHEDHAMMARFDVIGTPPNVSSVCTPF
jgi:FtsP/CotA-like multicopper oxidase with cupredoxin domain